MTKSIRRVVTGHDAQGKSILVIDGAAPNVSTRRTGAVTVTELWETTESPADNRGSEDAADRPFRQPPSANGSIFRVIEYPPDKVRLAALQTDLAEKAQAAPESASLYKGEGRHPGFHRTNSIDYVIVLAGEIYALMDEGETLLKAGDVLIQRGTNHAWSNRSDASAFLAFVLIDAKPIE
jgi:hypothetical protein